MTVQLTNWAVFRVSQTLKMVDKSTRRDFPKARFI